MGNRQVFIRTSMWKCKCKLDIYIYIYITYANKINTRNKRITYHLVSFVSLHLETSQMVRHFTSLGSNFSLLFTVVHIVSRKFTPIIKVCVYISFKTYYFSTFNFCLLNVSVMPNILNSSPTIFFEMRDVQALLFIKVQTMSYSTYVPTFIVPNLSKEH